MNDKNQDRIFTEAATNLRDLCDEIIAGECKHMSAEHVQLLYGVMNAFVNIVAFQGREQG